MTAADWLPSEREWADAIAEKLLDGRIVLVRKPPRWGISELCGEIVQTLSSSSLLVSGSAFSHGSQKEDRLRLDAEVSNLLSSQGLAQVVFDDYGSAVRGPQGGALHSLLYRMLVDRPTARDTGALLVADFGEDLDYRFSGSPLLSRAEVASLPRMTETDCISLGLDPETARKSAGNGTWLLRPRIARDDHSWTLHSVERLKADRTRICQALPLGALQTLTGQMRHEECDPVDREALAQLGSVDRCGEFQLSDFARAAHILEEISNLNPGWPKGRRASVRKFAELIVGGGPVIWVDRYLLKEASLAAQFIENVQSLKGEDIAFKLLSSRNNDSSLWEQGVASAFENTPNVEVRLMTRQDRHRLHDRHLVLPGTRSGFSLPTSRVILSQDDPGSAVALRMPALALDYDECWSRADRLR